MKFLNLKKKNEIFLLLCISILVFSSLGSIITFYQFTYIESISSDNDTENDLNTAETFIYTLNGKKYLAEYITREKVKEMKEQIGVRDPNKNYNQIIDGHGTGYAPPTEESLENLIGKISLLHEIRDPSQPSAYRAAIDLSGQIYFPIVGDQMSQGSCSAWANAYYAYGYLEAKDYGWDASSGNPDYLLSPAWVYNKVAAFDYGSVPSHNGLLIQEWGCATMTTMPYNDADVDSWGDEPAWREAPYHRLLDFTLMSYVGPSTIDTIKSLIDGETPVTFGIDAYQFSNGLDDITEDYILSSLEYDDSGSLNHAQCIVGYDDAITEGSDVGAFRVVNSWGDWMDSGYYWFTYDAFNEIGDVFGQEIMFFSDRIGYNPSLIATWEFAPAPTRMDDIITLGVGPHDAPLDTITPHYDNDEINLFPEFMALDISEFQSYYDLNNDVLFYLELGSSHTSGIISSFLIERYISGALQEITPESPDVPKTTPGYVYGTFMALDHELKVYLEVPEDPSIYSTYIINATVTNTGLNDEYDVDLLLYLDDVIVNSITIPSLLVGASEIINYMWTPTGYKTYNFTAYAPPVPGESFTSNNILTELITLRITIFFEDFESGLSQWDTITGLWHLTDDSSAWPDPYHSPTHSMWFGQEATGDYDTGFREMGDLISVPIDLSDTTDTVLNFFHWRESEQGWDYSYVYISIDGINWDLLYYTDANILPWEKVSLDISKYAGNSSVQLRFFFDTTDSVNNYFRGWLVDDIEILGTGSYDHELSVSLEVPTDPEIDQTYIIDATVINTGENDETNVDLFLYLDDVIVNSITIPSLLVGASEIINYMWTPTEYKTYNFTAYAPPVPDEEFINNNIATEIIPIVDIKLFDGMFINYTFTIFDTVYPSEFTYSYVSGKIFHVDWLMPTQLQYWDVDAQTRIMQGSSGGFAFGDGYHTPIWIFTDVSLGDEILIAADAEGDHLFSVAGELIYDLPGFGPVDVWVLEDLDLPGGVAWYEKSTGILLNGTFYFSGGASWYTFDFVDTNVEFTYISFDHELSVSLDTPVNPKIGNSYIIDATVTNDGLNDEYDVDLLLYLDDIIVESTTISSLPVGASETISYMWIPPDFGSYNFTAYAPPVTDEIHTGNNFITKIIPIVDTKLFDGMYIEHIYTESSSGPSMFSYSYYSGSLFIETWDIMGFSIPWYVDSQTRLMSGGSVFGDGTHTPAWIFTDVSLGDEILIATDAEGDHLFSVASELIYDLPGFGLVEVWELEDLDLPGGVAWYEKSTGILLNATFLYAGGAGLYTFDFVDTNVEFIYAIPPSPFVLSSNAETPDDNGNFDLNWTASDGALNYFVYQYSSYITEINGSLTLLGDGITDLSLALSGYTDGTYYFIAVAHNAYGDTRSNCIEVVVQIPSDGGIPDYYFIFAAIGIIVVIGIVIAIIIIKRRK